MATCPVQWRTVHKGGDPITDQEGTTRTPGWHPEETEALTARRGTLKPAWSASTHSEGKGPEDPGQRVQDSLFPLTVPRIQFTDRVLILHVMLRRRGTHSGTVQKTDEFPQMQFLEKLMTSVVVQRLVPGRVGADNCGGSAGAVLEQV